MSTRKATHAATWYTDSGSALSKQLESWLEGPEFTHGPARAIISPHASYRYSGACAAYSFKQIQPELVRKIFILGPSHWAPFSGCALTKTAKYETPLYDLEIDVQVNKDLRETGNFEWMDLSVDEKEHSIEMQLPLIAKVMENYKNQFTVIPILVGSITTEQQEIYGRIFSSYLADPHNLFIISSDFCHWGKRFNYTYIDDSFPQIFQSIEHLDRTATSIIEKLSVDDFKSYLVKYENTICGRRGIIILLQTVRELQKIHGKTANFKVLKYSQSHQCLTKDDSSVSYVAASLVVN